MGVDEKVISVSLDNVVSAVNFCCCECRMVSGEGRMGAVGDVSAGYTQSLRVVGCLANEARSLKDCKVTERTDRIVSDKQQGELNRDVNFSRHFLMRYGK